MPKVYNRKHVHQIPEGAVYVGRGSPWGNPYTHLDGELTREECISNYEYDLLHDETRMAKCREELRGKDLVCYCKPLACHADVLIR